MVSSTTIFRTSAELAIEPRTHTTATARIPATLEHKCFFMAWAAAALSPQAWLLQRALMPERTHSTAPTAMPGQHSRRRPLSYCPSDRAAPSLIMGRRIAAIVAPPPPPPARHSRPHCFPGPVPVPRAPVHSTGREKLLPDTLAPPR